MAKMISLVLIAISLAELAKDDLFETSIQFSLCLERFDEIKIKTHRRKPPDRSYKMTLRRLKVIGIAVYFYFSTFNQKKFSFRGSNFIETDTLTLSHHEGVNCCISKLILSSLENEGDPHRNYLLSSTADSIYLPGVFRGSCQPPAMAALAGNAPGGRGLV